MARRYLTKHYINYKDGRVYALYYRSHHVIFYNTACNTGARVIVYKQ